MASNSNKTNSNGSNEGKKMSTSALEYSYGEKLDLDQSFYSDESERRRSQWTPLAGVASLVAGIAMLIATIFLWILYYRTRSAYYFWLAIYSTILGLLSAACFGIAIMLNGQIKSKMPENKNLSSVMYIVNIISACFLLLSILIILFWRYIHFNRLVLLFDQKDTFQKRYPDGFSFEDAWKSDKKYIWWSAIFMFLSGVSHLICTFLMWTITRHVIELSRAALSVCGGIATGLLCMSVYASIQAVNNHIPHPSISELVNATSYSFLKWVGIVLIVLVVLNLLLNLVKHKRSYLIFGILLIIFVLPFAIVACINLRTIRNNLKSGQDITESCIDGLLKLNKDDISNSCNKYLGPGESCGKALELYGSDANGQKLSLYPGCARNARIYLFAPLINACIYALYAALFAGIVIACDFYCADPRDEIETYNRVSNPLDFVGVALAIIFLLIFFGYLIFAKNRTFRVEKRLIVDEKLFKELESGKRVEPGFTTIPLSIQSVDRKSVDVCVPYSKTNFVSLADNPACPYKKCGYRLFMLGESLTFYIKTITSPLGSFGLRDQSYPNARNSLDSFLHLFGTAKDINDQLSAILFCQKRYNEDLSIFYNIEEVDLDTLNYNGVKFGEIPVVTVESASGTRGFPTGYSYGTNLVCSDVACQYENRIPPGAAQSTITGTIYIRRKDSTVYDYLPADLASKITINSYHGADLYSSSPPGVVSTTGAFSFKVPASTNSIYPLRVEISDSNGYLKKYTKEIPIGNIDKEVVTMGRIIMILPSGQGCLGDTDQASCLTSNQTPGKGDLLVRVFNPDTNKPVPKANLTLASGHLMTKPSDNKVIETDENGEYRFKDLEFGYYSLFGWSKELLENSINVNFDSITNTAVFYLLPNKMTAMDVTVQLNNGPTTDTDIKLKFKTDDGIECRIVAENKYCGYAAYIYDVGKGASGVETVRIFNLTVATYMAFTETYYNEVDTCPSIINSKVHFAEFAGLRSRHMDIAAPDTSDKTKRVWVAYCFTGYGQASIKNVNQKFSEEPSIKVCEDLYPEGDKYSLMNLRKDLQPVKA